MSYLEIIKAKDERLRKHSYKFALSYYLNNQEDEIYTYLYAQKLGGILS